MKQKLLISLFFFGFTNYISAQYWSGLSTGLWGRNNVFGEAVYALKGYNGEVYAGGLFDTAGGIPAKNIAKWDGASWLSLGPTMTNSSGWPASISTLEVYNGELYAGGMFDTINGVAAKNIAKWNGVNWSPVGLGIDTVWSRFGFDASVNTLAVYNGELYAGGYFTTAGGVPAMNIAKWNGTNWSAVSTGVGIPSSGTGISDIAISLEVYNGELYVGGKFSIAGNVGVNNIAKWNGTNWSSPGAGINDVIYDMTAHNGVLYIGGRFTFSGSTPVRNIIKWDGTNWSALSSGINGPVYTLSIYNGALYAGGYFDNAGGVEVRNMAKWNGSGWSATGSGLNDIVMCSDTLNGSLFIGGHFTGAGEIDAIHIAKWNDQCITSPAQPGNITGTACLNHNSIFSIAHVIDAANYTWTLPPGWSGSSATNSIITVPGNNNGVISVTANNPCGSSNARTLSITVNPVPPQPGTINGNDTVCQNTTQTYTINPVAGAINYTWSLPPGWIGSSSTNSISTIAGSESGIISVTANNDYCGSVAQTFEVTVNPLPPKPILWLNGPGCRDSSVTYFVDPIPGVTSYTWTLPAGWTGQSTTETISVTFGSNSGNVSVYGNNNCGAGNAESVTITVDSVPATPDTITGDLFVNTGQTSTYLINPVTGAISYQWFVKDGVILSGQGTNIIIVNWLTPGTHIVTVKAINDCGSAQQSIKVNVSDPDDDPFKLNLYPNPSNGQFYLIAKRSENKQICIEILDAFGQSIYNSEKFTGSNNFFKQFNINKYSEGLYFVKIMIDHAVYTRKIVLVKK